MLLMKNTLKVTLGGVIAALSIALMFLTAVIPFGTYAFPTFAGILLCVIVIEFGYPWAFGVYFVVSSLSMLLLSDKEAALFYAAFLGYYPIIKSLLERIRSRVVQYIIKLLIFNAAMVAAFYIGILLLGIPKDSFVLFGVYLPWVFLLLGNAFFFVYDLSVTKLVTIYLVKYHDRVNKATKL